MSPQFTTATEFTADGYATVSINDRYGIIDTKGSYTINPQFDWLGTMENDRAAYENKGKIGYINLKGQRVIVEQFDFLIPLLYPSGNFGSDHYAVVRFGDKYGVIGNDGKYSINPQFDGLFGCTG